MEESLNSFIECPRCASRSMNVSFIEDEAEKYAGFAIVLCSSFKCPFNVRIPLDKDALRKARDSLHMT